MKNYRIRRSVALALVLLLALVNSACVDLAAIQKFTASATEIGKRFPNLANDLSASCKRQHIYQEVRAAQFQPDRLRAITHPDPDSEEMTKLDGQCKQFTEQQKRLIEANAVLINYLATMGDLAADDLTSYDKGLEGLGSSFTKGNIFNDAEVSAVQGLVGFLLKAASEGYRRKKLKSALEDQNSHIQTLTKALRRLVAQNYILQLQNERDEMRNYYSTSILLYRDYMRQLVARTAEERAQQGQLVQDPLPIIQVKRLWDDEETEIAKKIEAANAYAKALDSIAEGHQKLYESRNNLGSKEVVRTALTYAKTIQSVVEDFRKAF
ncbi:MAG: hypothetical protein H0W99_02695 [Acidobacteria bacterium]|nr:hypothetical protein [Acidobacteriota bacterium]